MANADEKYLNFSDNTMKDRLAARAAGAALKNKSKRGSSQPAVVKDTFKLEPSGRCEGWDKYYFFSVPASKRPKTPEKAAASKGKGLVKIEVVPDPPLNLPTANLGRSRPAFHGPQTFCTEAFSKERIAKERERLEKRGARTNYTENHSQIPRASTALLGLPNYEGQKFAVTEKNTISPGEINRSASETLLQGPPPAMVHSSGCIPRQRMGPHWPPPTEKRPDSLSTREALFPGGHRTFVDLYSADRPASRGVGYAVHVG